MSTATRDVRFSLQNRYADGPLLEKLRAYGISNGVVTVSGRAIRAEKDITKEDFLAADADGIRSTLIGFLESYDLPRDGDTVVLDMEPKGFSPPALGGYEGEELRALIDAYRLRIKIAREVLSATNELALYQVVVPDGRGRTTEQFDDRMRGYQVAGRRGMYDELDYICPVLYQRFGDDDAEPETVRRWTDAATRQAIEESLALTRSNDEHIPLAPFLSFWVFNGNSENDRQAASPERGGRQLRVLQCYAGVAMVVFWSASQTKEEMEAQPKPVEPIDIGDFLCAAGWRALLSRV